MIFDTNLLIISSLSFASLLVFLIITYRDQLSDKETDNKLDNRVILQAAANSHKWRWFSDIHKLAATKTGTRAVTIILISFFQNIFRNKTGDYPYFAAGGFSVSISIILIYLIGSNYWNPSIGLFIAILFLISFWPWQVALYGGHISIGTMMFLFSVYFIQQTNLIITPELWLIIPGAFLFLFIYSSSSASKYIVLFFAAVFYEKFKVLLEQGLIKDIGTQILSNHSSVFNIWLPVLFLALFLLLKFNYEKITTAMYQKKSFSFLNKMINERNKFSPEHYINHARKKLNYYFIWGVRIILFLLLLINFIGFDYLIPIFGGFFIAMLILTLPNIKLSIAEYFNFVFGYSKSHFRIYVDFFAKKGLEVSAKTRGGGPKWVPKLFFRITPFHFIFFFISVVGIAISVILSEQRIVGLVGASLLLITSLLPTLWAEITRAPQMARVYFPGFVSAFLFIGYFIYKTPLLSDNLFGVGMIFILIVIFSWNLWKFLSDVYPVRMAVSNLVRALESRGIKEFYTYKTIYNCPFIGDVESFMLKRFKIKYIDSIKDVKKGWIFIPETSNKSLSMESRRKAFESGDFTKDPVLNKLLETKKIEEIATVKIKAFGASNIWVQESEVTSFRDLMLNEVKEKDYFRGYVWLINAENLSKAIG